MDVLLLAASQQPLADAVAAGKLRTDLAARLGVCTVSLPALSGRREDIAPLFRHFVHDQAKREWSIDSELIEWLCLQPWEQNVRGLEWLARTLVTLHADAARLTLDHLPRALHPGPSARDRVDEGLAPVVRRAAMDDATLYVQLRRALADNGGVMRRAAETLGITRQKAYRLLDKQGVALDDLRSRQAFELAPEDAN